MEKEMISDRDMVMVGQQPWDTKIGSNCKDIAQEFSRHNRVLYVNAPLDRNTILKQRNNPDIQKRLRVVRGQEAGLEAVAANLWVLNPDQVMESINWLPPSAIYTFINRVNNRRFASAIAKAVASLGFRDFILFNDNDIFRSFYLRELLQPAVSVYYSRDYMLATDYWRKHGRVLEPQLIADSDLCVANSEYLASYCRTYNPHSFYVGQGCGVIEKVDSNSAAMPPDLAQLKGPIIGYVGALTSLRLDLKVLEHIAKAQPDWTLALVGPEDETFKSSSLHQLPNVYFLGQKAPEELAAYIKHFNVCLNPQVVNQMTIGNYPRKIDEYLALGKPVVATATEAMSAFREHTYLAKSQEEYVRLIDLAMQQDSRALQEMRRAFAATHTWENSVGEIYKAILSCHPATHATPLAVSS